MTIHISSRDKVFAKNVINGLQKDHLINLFLPKIFTTSFFILLHVYCTCFFFIRSELLQEKHFSIYFHSIVFTGLYLILIDKSNLPYKVSLSFHIFTFRFIPHPHKDQNNIKCENSAVGIE